MPLPIRMVSPGAAALIARWIDEEQPPVPPGFTQRVAAVIGSDEAEIRMPVMIPNAFSEPLNFMAHLRCNRPAHATSSRARCDFSDAKWAFPGLQRSPAAVVD